LKIAAFEKTPAQSQRRGFRQKTGGRGRQQLSQSFTFEWQIACSASESRQSPQRVLFQYRVARDDGLIVCSRVCDVAGRFGFTASAILGVGCAAIETAETGENAANANKKSSLANNMRRIILLGKHDNYRDFA
jgi:hypothetical protein